MSSPLPNINADPNKAPSKIEVEWLARTGEVCIDSTPRTVALLRGRYGEVALSTIRVQFPLGLPENFEAWIAIHAAEAYAGKRGIVTARLQGKRRVTCHVDLPVPTDPVSQFPILVNRHRSPADYFQWVGQRQDLRATPSRGLAFVVQCNQPCVCEVFVGGV